MTRFEIHDRAQRIAQISVPNFNVQPKDSLYWQSVAEQQIAEAAGDIVQHKASITLDPASADGLYTLPSDFKNFDSLRYSPGGVTRALWPVEIRTDDHLTDVMQRDVENSLEIPLGAPDSGGTLFAAVRYDKLVVYPRSVPGTLEMRYVPHLTPYSPSSPLWSDYAADPEAAMKTRGLDDTMSDALDGIVSFCVAHMLMAQPGGTERFPQQVALHLKNFERSKYPVARNRPQGLNSTPQKLYPIGGF